MASGILDAAEQDLLTGVAMPRYRNHLPQLNGDLFLADGGMGTTLLFRYGIDLPHFCSFHLVGDPAGRQVLIDYFRPYAAVTRAQRAGFVLDSGPPWRASSDWGNRLGYSAAITRCRSGPSPIPRRT